MIRRGVSRAIAIGAVVVVVLVIAIIYALFFMPTGPKVFEVELREFSFDLVGDSFPISVKVGEQITFRIKNLGTVTHEFMIVKDKDFFINAMHQKIQELMGQTEDLEAIKGEIEDFHMALMMQNKDLIVAMTDLAPGEGKTLEVTFDEPGTYWVICLEVEGTLPQIHAEKGMVAEIIVTS